jgi:hypothetical protein
VQVGSTDSAGMDAHEQPTGTRFRLRQLR